LLVVSSDAVILVQRHDLDAALSRSDRLQPTRSPRGTHPPFVTVPWVSSAQGLLKSLLLSDGTGVTRRRTAGDARLGVRGRGRLRRRFLAGGALGEVVGAVAVVVCPVVGDPVAAPHPAP
jgi:hypothetical protein